MLLAAWALAIGSPRAVASGTYNATVIGTAGQNTTIAFSGTAPALTNATSDCTPFHNTPAVDDTHFNLTFANPGAVGTTIDVTLDFTIQWTSGAGGNVAHDLILTVIDPNGDSHSSDGGSPSERVTLTNTSGGQYHAVVCGFSNVSPQPFTGTLNIKTTSHTTQPSLPSAPAQGLEFSAAVPADQQRDEAEPLIEADRSSQLYTCGPTGFSNAADYAQVSWDGGDQFHMLGTPPRGQQSNGGGGDCGMAMGLTRNPLGNYQYAYTGLAALSGFATATSANNGHNLGTNLCPEEENCLPGIVPTGLPPDELEPGAGADRQWLVFIDPAQNPVACNPANPAAAGFPPIPPSPTANGCVLMSYNRLAPRNTVVQTSVNGGLTYSAAVHDAAQDTDFPGPLRYFAPRNLVYFPWSFTGPNGEPEVRLSVSTDGGVNWKNCYAATAPGDIPPFVIADHDQNGNIYVVYSAKGSFHAYMVTLSSANVAKCNLPITNTSMVNPGFSAPVQVDRNTVRTAVFPWIVASGKPGRVAVTFYGTTTDGDPAFGCRPNNPPAMRGFCAAWHVYVNQSLNALSATPTFSQVRATTHPFHYDSICLEGLACDLGVPPGDRTLADFFSIDLNPITHRLAVVFNRAEKKPNEDFGHVANPMVFTQIAGPKNDQFASLTRDWARAALRAFANDPGGDALSSYSLALPGDPVPVAGVPPTDNELSGDFLSARVAPEFNLNSLAPVANGGFTVTFSIKNLTSTAIRNTLNRTSGQSMIWIWRFVNGYQAAAAVAAYNPTLDLPTDGTPADGFTFGYNNYATGVTPCLGVTFPEPIPTVNPSEKCVLYPGNATVIPGLTTQTILGRVTLNHVTGVGTIRMSVPRALLRALGPNDGFGRPTEVPATSGSRFFDATAFSLVNTVSPTQAIQSFLYPLDNTRAFDFTLGSGTIPQPGRPLDPVVALTKTGPATATRGSTITYTIAYENFGQNAASSAQITDALPAGLTFVSAAGGLSRSYDPATRRVTWNLGDVAGGARGSVTVRATVSAAVGVGSTIVNSANFTAPNTVSPPTASWATLITS